MNNISYFLSNFISKFCGLILIFAVLSKTLDGANGAVSPLPMLSPSVQSLGVLLESVIGVWLVLKAASIGSALVGAILFAVLGGISLYLGLDGQSSCNCFGRISVSPWASLALDVICGLALLGVLVSQWRRQSFVDRRREVLIGLSTLGSVVALGAALATPAGELFRARLRGAVLLLPDGDANAGNAPKGETRIIPVTVENLSNKPVRLIGGTSNCICVSTTDLPVEMPPLSRMSIHVVVRFTGGEGPFLHSFEWYTDSTSQPRIRGRIRGRVEAGVRTTQPARERAAGLE